MSGRTGICRMCGRTTVATGARGPTPSICSARCRAMARQPRDLARSAMQRAGRSMFVETVCLRCGRAIVRPRKKRGRHARYCSVKCRTGSRERGGQRKSGRRGT